MTIWSRDQELIKKLQLNADGKYQRFSQGDVDYLILTIKQCAELESQKRSVYTKPFQKTEGNNG